jgi:hypothetical protein
LQFNPLAAEIIRIVWWCPNQAIWCGYVSQASHPSPQEVKGCDPPLAVIAPLLRTRTMRSETTPERFGEPRKDVAYYARRTTLMSSIILVHALIIIAVLFDANAKAKPHYEPHLISVFTSPAPAPAAPTPVKKPHEPVVSLPAIIKTKVTIAVEQPVSGTGIGTGCSLASTIATAIEGDPNAMQALAALPASYRTAADAVMLWNGEWAHDDTASLSPTAAFSFFAPAAEPDDGPIAPLKNIVVMTLAMAPEDCLQATVAGPQLIPIHEQNRTTMLAIGSGEWQWANLAPPQDLLATSASALDRGLNYGSEPAERITGN